MQNTAFTKSFNLDLQSWTILTKYLEQSKYPVKMYRKKKLISTFACFLNAIAKV